jgi:hypothetical protein
MFKRPANSTINRIKPITDGHLDDWGMDDIPASLETLAD